MKKIIDSLLLVTSHLDLHEVLGEIVTAAGALTGTKYAAIGVLDNAGQIDPFVSHGVDDEVRGVLAHPAGVGVLAAIPSDGALVLNDLTTHPEFRGFPDHHPMMRSFLGVPILIGTKMYGRLYVAEKTDGFNAEDVEHMHMLASAAAIAVQNSALYEEARTREKWLAAGQEITAAMLHTPEVEDALELIASRIRQVAEADTACIVLPGLKGEWLIEIIDGEHSEDLLGIAMPPSGRARQVIKNGTGIIVDSLSRARTLRVPEFGRFGPALYAPLVANGNSHGVIILLRHRGAAEFTPGELTIAEAIAAQAALALKLSEARAAKDLAALMEERARIGRDLHDLAIQQLFATGLQLTKAVETVTDPGMKAELAEAIDGVDDSVRQIRAIVRTISSEDDSEPILERLQREVSLARTGLGFAPSLVLLFIDDDGAEVTGLTAEEQGAQLEDMYARLSQSLTDDLVAVVREGLANAARHAQAASVHVRLIISPSTVTVEVEDDGVGISEHRARNSGLANLGSRARRHDGEFTLTRLSESGGSLLHWSARLSGVPFSQVAQE